MISSTTRVAGPYAGTGAQTVFPFSYKVFQNSDVLVLQTDASGNITTLALTSAYSVALNSNQDTTPGGSITLVSALPTGYSLVLSSQVPQLQSTNLTNAGNFYPSVINNALDYLTILIQQLYTAVAGALRFPIGDSATNNVLPSVTNRANNLLGFDAYGNPIAIAAAAQSATALTLALAAQGGGALVGNTPAGGIVSTTVQAALNEIKTSLSAFAKLTGATFAGVLANGNVSFSGGTIDSVIIGSATPQSATFTSLTINVAANAPAGSASNNLVNFSQILGLGQTETIVTRVSGTTYTNSTGKPIFFNISFVASFGVFVTATMSINGGTAIMFAAGYSPSGPTNMAGSILIPSGATYTPTYSSAGTTITITELR